VRTLALLVFLLAFTCPAHASSQTSRAAQRTLEDAVLLAGPSVAGLPIVLTAVLPDGASRGIEAWTLSQNGLAERIVVYSESDVFRCASHPILPNYQCLLKVASTIIHEAWHYRHGPGEAGAYDTQIAFLTRSGGSSLNISGVRRARAHVLAAQRAIERSQR
jgi:hypothetical protein